MISPDTTTPTTASTQTDETCVVDAILEDILAISEADTCLFVRIVELDRRLYYTGVQTVGDGRHGRLTHELDGQLVDTESAQLIRRPPSVDHFTDHRPRACLGDTTSTVLDEASACSQLLVYDEDVCVGLVLAVRWAPESAFGERTRSRLDAQAPQIRSELVSAERNSRTSPESMYLTCRRSGETVGACNLASGWLDQSRRQGIEAIVADFASRPKTPDDLRLVDGMITHLSPVRDEDDFTLIIVRLEPAAPAKMAPDASLTPTQREVAEFAIAGATALEIAAAMDRSVHTVRSHLKNIYERLHVASRVELLEALRDGGD